MAQSRHKKRVLIVGSDAVLLATRRDVLGANGIATETKLIEALPPDVTINPDVALVVACSSLSEAARQVVMKAAHSIQPKLPCVVIAPDCESLSAPAGADAMLGAFEGPERFVKCIEAMISY